MSVNPSSTTMSTDDTNQFGSREGSSGFLNCSLKILEELQLLYEERMKTLDTEAAGDADRLKVQTLQSWVKDLGEQNGLLVRTVEELEREMAQRVMLLEEKFHMTSHETQKFMTQAEHVNNRLQEGRSSRDFVSSSAADSSNSLQDFSGRSSMLLESQVAHLKNDRENLCKLIQRGLETGNWSTKRFQFYEISDYDIFGPAFSFSNASVQDVAGNLKDTQEGEVYLHTELLTLRQNQEAMERELDDRDRIIKDNLSTMKSHIELKEQQICDLKQTIQSLQGDNHYKPSTSVAVMTDAVVCLSESEREETDMVRLALDKDIAVLARQLQEAEFRNEFMAREKERLADELASVHRELHFKVQEAAALTRVISDMDKAAMDKQAALTAEVADKHDQISAMRRESLQLEEQCCQAAKQTTLKDSIIKEMRKEIKTNRAKICELEQNIPRKLSDPDRNKMHHRLVDKIPDSNHLAADHKDNIAVPKLSGEQPWSGYQMSKSKPGSTTGFPPQNVRFSGEESEVSVRCRGGTSPPSKDTQVRGASNDRAQIEEKDKLIAYLEARISTLQMAALPSQEIDQIFFNKDRQSKSSVTFVASRAENHPECSDVHEVMEYRELAEREHCALESVKKQLLKVLDREAVREDELITSLREQQSIIDEYCRKSKELEEKLDRTQSDLHIALLNVREKDELLHNSSKRSNDEANIVQEQLERINAMENAMNGRENEILKLLAENRELWERCQGKDEDFQQMTTSLKSYQDQHQRCTCAIKEKRIRLLQTENRKMTRNNQGKEDRLRHLITENFKLRRKIKQLLMKIKKISLEQQNAVDTVNELNTRLEVQLQDAWKKLCVVEEEDKRLESYETQLQMNAERCNSENLSRIEEMQNMLDSKTEEIKIWKLAMNNLQQKHDALLRHIHRQEQEVNDLEIKLSSECGCRRHAENVLESMQIELESSRNARFQIQNDLQRLQQNNQATNTHSLSLRAMVSELKMKLDLSEKSYESVVSTVEVKQANLVEAAFKEAALQEEFTNKEAELLERLRDAHSEELKLNDLVNALNEEVQRLVMELADKDRVLSCTAKELHHITQYSQQLQCDLEKLDDANSRLQSAQERLECLEKQAPEMEMLTSVLQQVNEKQNQHIYLLKNRLQNTEEKSSCIQEQLHFLIENKSQLEENYRKLELRNNTLNSELSSLENECECLRNESSSVQNNALMKVESSHSSTSRESQSGDRVRYLCEIILQKESQIRRLHYANCCLLKTIKKLFSQNSLMRKKLELYKAKLSFEIEKNQWPRLTHPDSKLANVVVVTQSETYSTSTSNCAVYPDSEYNATTSAHMAPHPVICHEYQSTTFTNEHNLPPCAPRASQFSRFRSETLASHAR